MKQYSKVQIKVCPLCKSNNLDSFCLSGDYFLSKETFNIDQCLDCGLKLTNPRPNNSDLPSYYESSDYVSHSNTQHGIINKIYHLVRSYTLHSKHKIIKNYVHSGNLLDIGSGSGEFLAKAKINGFHVTGIEPNHFSRNLSIQKYQLNVFPEEQINHLPSGKFDIITMWHVLEHVIDIDEMIKQLQRLLSENGIIVIAVPNSACWDAKHYGKFWAAYDLPRHLYHFDQKTLIRLFKGQGFKLIRIKPMPFDSYYISLLSEKYKNGKTNYFKGFINGLRSNLSASVTGKNYSSLMFIFKYK